MRILVVSQYFWPEDFRINELVTELAGRGHAMTVLTGVPNYPRGIVFPEYAAHPDRFSVYNGVEVIRAPMVTRGSGGLRLAMNYASFAAGATVAGIKKLRGRRFDAVFVFEPSPVTVGLPAVALRAMHGWPVAFWVLDQWPETLAAVGSIRSRHILRLVGQLVSFIYTRCDVVLAQSRSLVDVIRRYAGGSRVVYFPNWAEGGYSASGVSPAAEVPGANGDFTVMFAGNIGESQDFGAILDAAEQLKTERVRWVIIGDGRAASWVREEVKRRGLGERVLMLGRFPQERMPSFFKRADALLVSLKPEPLFAMTVPGKVQSYLAFGVPILAMLDGDGARIVEEAEAGYTAPAGNAAALAAAIRRMAALSPQQRADMGGRGRDYARREFDRDALITSLENLLASIARVRTPASA